MGDPRRPWSRGDSLAIAATVAALVLAFAVGGYAAAPEAEAPVWGVVALVIVAALLLVVVIAAQVCAAEDAVDRLDRGDGR
jgi:hypothetical protein